MGSTSVSTSWIVSKNAATSLSLDDSLSKYNAPELAAVDRPATRGSEAL